MEIERIENIKNWPELLSIRKIQIFIDFANFYRRFIQNFSVIAGPLILMPKTDPGLKTLKPVKKKTITSPQPNCTLFPTSNIKKSFQNLK